ncbi:MAG: hypothetical protein U0736_20795 [Gemmataceae bacterium]
MIVVSPGASTGESMVYPVATETVFRNADGTGAQTTTYMYTWFPDSGQIRSQTVTRPAVSAAQNGPGTPTSETAVSPGPGMPPGSSATRSTTRPPGRWSRRSPTYARRESRSG